MKTIQNVLSLFDGISCGALALQRANIKYNNYYASEINKYAIQVTQHNFPNTIQLGDVTKIKSADLPKIDLLIGGSPCQGFSFCGKQLNFEDPRSKLFFEFVRLLKETSPKYFLLENVRMKKEYQDVISEHLGVSPIMINSSLVSAQNRVRLYWTNIPNVAQPKDINLSIFDILEIKPDIKINKLKKSLQIEEIGRGGQGYRVYSLNGKSPTLISSSGGLAGTANCLIKIPQNQKKYIPKECSSYLVDPYNKKSWVNNKSSALRTNVSNGNLWVKFGDLYRNLTRVECERLQTVPDNYTSCISDSQAKQALGNGWTVDVIAHIFNNIN
jgi:DNA-cytosine methyltransferase